jgi:putative membrane protein
MEFLGKLMITAIAVIIVSYLLPGVHLEGIVTAIIVAAVLSFLNVIVKPVLILLTIPITIFTLGLFLLVINAVIIIITDAIIPGFQVDGFWWALFFSLILSVLNSIFGSLAEKDG